MSWQQDTLDKWTEMITEDGDDFEAVAKASLQYATMMIEAALRHPEWARGFIQLAIAPSRPAHHAEESAIWVTEQFPVAMQV